MKKLNCFIPALKIQFNIIFYPIRMKLSDVSLQIKNDGDFDFQCSEKCVDFTKAPYVIATYKFK